MTNKEIAMLVELMIELHILFDSDQKAATNWLNTKNLNFGKMKPKSLIENGKIQKLHAFVMSGRL